ncbi:MULTISPECIES: hypothetical protein [Sphingomonas]|uniref:hypothetical protein n=1 Tax=Sphingomonas TaxID=13687 RepID=UPI000F7E58CB|nr:hypothetical protein [Sphingomonas sp. ABOLF]RSV13471.1 hypothetical protein CA235_15535 [Sphingomonas sp. ABOLF]GLK22597.1 hypothetical protein GCM10017606_34250 [Microbacterium terregens]
MACSNYALLPSVLFMVGCPAGKPSEKVVEQIEGQLAADPCLKNIASMRRTYAFARRGWKIDPNRIDVSIERAGFDGLPAGRIITSPPSQVGIDERERFSAAATYVVSADALDIWACGGTRSGLRHLPRF